MQELYVDNLIKIGDTTHSGLIKFHTEADNHSEYIALSDLVVHGFNECVTLNIDGLSLDEQARIWKLVIEFLEEIKNGV